MLSFGNLSPAVIAPSELERVLLENEEQLSQRCTLPFKHEQVTWTFYKTIIYTKLLDTNYSTVVIAILF